MRIFCPAIKQRPYFIVLALVSDLLGEDVRPAPTRLRVRPPRSGVSWLSTSTWHTRIRAGRCLEWRPGGRAERDLLVRRERATTSAADQQLRKTCSVVNVRAPAIPPEQPHYLDRDPLPAPNRVRLVPGILGCGSGSGLRSGPCRPPTPVARRRPPSARALRDVGSRGTASRPAGTAPQQSSRPRSSHR